MKKILLVIICLLFAQYEFAQTDGNDSLPNNSQLINVLPPAEMDKITEADNMRKRADETMAQADKMWADIDEMRRKSSSSKTEPSEKSRMKDKSKDLKDKALKKETEALKMYRTANETKYLILQNNFKAVKTNFTGDGKQKKEAESYEDLAENYFNEAQSKRKSLEKLKDPARVNGALKEVTQQEFQAIEKQMKAYSIYLNYKYQSSTAGVNAEEEEIDYTVVDFSKIDYANLDYSKPDMGIAQQANMNVENTQKQKTTTQMAENTANVDSVKSTASNATTTKTSAGITYRIQITTEKSVIPDNQLKSIYKGTLAIQQYFDKGWYKYTIGDYKTYEEAIGVRKKCGVVAAFVVAYENGKEKAVPMNDKTPVVYKVQIAADTKELTEEKLKTIYSGTEKISNFINQSGWYKYTIGEFATYGEALKLKKISGVKGAFISAYKNGKKINIEEAIKQSVK